MSLEKKTILVTGGTGFIGSALVRALLEAGARVRTLDDESRRRSARPDLMPGVDRVVGDVRNPSHVADAIRGVDQVVHLAYVNGTEFFYSKPELVLEVAVKGMMNVLDGCIAHGVRDLVLASSSEVYQTPPVVPTDETVALSVPDPLNPRFSYGGGKIISELLALNFGRKHFDRVAIFRPHNVYGPDMGWEHVIPQFALRIQELASAQPSGILRVPIQGTGAETRAFLHVSDAALGIRRVIEAGAHLGIYHVGSAREVSVDWLLRRVGLELGREVEPIAGELAEGSTLRRCPDIRKLTALGWTPRVELEQGLAETVRWYRNNAGSRPATSQGIER